MTLSSVNARIRSVGTCNIRAYAGFSLIELMVVIIIIGFLAMASAPFTRTWVDGVRQREAVNVLNQAVGQAKGLAMRNPTGLANTLVAARMSLASGGAVTVQGFDSAGALITTPVWSGTVHSSVNVLEPDSSEVFACVDYNSLGIAIATNDCTIVPVIEVRITNSTLELINVELL